MKPTFTFAFIFLLGTVLQLNGQITITSSDMPNADDSVRLSFSGGPIDPSLTGANYNWNFGSLVPNAQMVQVFVSPLNFTVPYNFIFNPFNTSYGAKQYTPDSLGGFQPSDAYNYLKESSGNLKKVGMGMTINSIPLPMQFDQPDYIYRFPMNYGNIDSCDAHVELTIPGFGTYAQFIHRVNEVDGWGQLTTPLGTVSSLRIKSIIHTRDSIAPEDTTMSGFAFNRPPAYEYKWFSAGSKLPYLEVDATDLGGGPTVTNIIYQDVYQPGIFQLSTTDIKTNDAQLIIYPNPASELLSVQYTLNQPTDVKVEMLDLTGKIVGNWLYPNQTPGTNIQTIPLKNLVLNPGTYLIRISGTNFSSSKKLMIR